MSDVPEGFTGILVKFYDGHGSGPVNMTIPVTDWDYPNLSAELATCVKDAYENLRRTERNDG